MQWTEGGVRDSGGRQLDEMADDEPEADWNALLPEPHRPETADCPALPCMMKSRDGTPSSGHRHSTPGGDCSLEHASQLHVHLDSPSAVTAAAVPTSLAALGLHVGAGVDPPHSRQACPADCECD